MDRFRRPERQVQVLGNDPRKAVRGEVLTMTRIAIVLPVLWLSFAATIWAQGGDSNYKRRRFNKAIELLEDGQPIYNSSARGGDGYDAGVKLASTYNDFIIYEMEDAEFNIAALRQFMLGLSSGGPTKSGHRMPAVIVKVGTLDDPSIFGGPDMAIFTVDKQEFHQIRAGLPTFERLPG